MSYRMSKVRAGPGGVTTCPRSGEAAKRINPTSKDWQLCGKRRTERSYSTFKIRRGSSEEIPLIQGKEQGCALMEHL